MINLIKKYQNIFSVSGYEEDLALEIVNDIKNVVDNIDTDAMGNLIGIVNAKTSETGIEGLGFAIPVNIAYQFFNRIMIVEPSLGIKVTYGSVNRVNGVYVTDIADESSKFELYDRIIAVNGKEVNTDLDYYSAINELSNGDTVTITVKRNYSNIDIKITLK